MLLNEFFHPFGLESKRPHNSLFWKPQFVVLTNYGSYFVDFILLNTFCVDTNERSPQYFSILRSKLHSYLLT